jgi:hypothetical protein
MKKVSVLEAFCYSNIMQSETEQNSERKIGDPLKNAAVRFGGEILRRLSDVVDGIVISDSSHERFVTQDQIQTPADIKKYYGAEQFRSWKRLNSSRPIHIILSPEGSRISSEAAKNLRPHPYPDMTQE